MIVYSSFIIALLDKKTKVCYYQGSLNKEERLFSIGMPKVCLRHIFWTASHVDNWGFLSFILNHGNCRQDPGRVVSAALYLDAFPFLSLLCLRICLQLKQKKILHREDFFVGTLFATTITFFQCLLYADIGENIIVEVLE